MKPRAQPSWQRVPIGLAAALSVLGCASQFDPYTADADTGSTHALISVERATPAGATGERAGALAGFVRIPPAVDSKSVLGLLGLTRELPPPGQCTSSSPRETRHTPLSQMGHVELLEAGDIKLEVGLISTQLSARAFPTVTDSISGVVYTTPDRSAEPLPAGARYVVRTTGNSIVPALLIEVQAPRALEAVTVSGVPLTDLQALPVEQPMDLTWAIGDAGDLVYVELAAADGRAGTLCTFRDEAGAGSIPSSTFTSIGAGRLSVHRTRSREFVKPGIDHGELRFDFELTASVQFTR